MSQTPAPIRLIIYQQELIRLIETLRRAEYNLGTAQQLDAQQLLLRLAQQNFLPDHAAALKPFLTPLLCHTPQEQNRFDGYFEPWAAQLEHMLRAAGKPAHKQATSPHTPLKAADIPPKTPVSSSST
ncbi:hypothetical protein [Candidatus Venteria ishoeyi]|uniref:Uncharacterized protein n=1 Tax=Candidatus Venteria ishoeyi TaxID=1899563 RepID=A0A1H6F633_9GAMM|nr:hypothetical protein [Candidatus Venteria ishoeyi]SEH05003.1 Uncharacterised protein [Candidatus Venteria ishoeyi]